MGHLYLLERGLNMDVSFSIALEGIKRGEHWSRRDWVGEGHYHISTDLKTGGTEKQYVGYYCDGCGFTTDLPPSSNDLLANDWYQREEELHIVSIGHVR